MSLNRLYDANWKVERRAHADSVTLWVIKMATKRHGNQLLFRANCYRRGNMPSLMQTAKMYGIQAVQPSDTLPGLALAAAQEVASGRASAEDADRVYVTYLDSVMVRSKAQSPGSRRVQVSKLRQIMLLAEEQPTQAHKLLIRVEKMHRELTREIPVKPLYAAMVDVARAQRNTRKQLNADELRARIAMPHRATRRKRAR